jgi:hypothetical protein
LRGKGIRIGLEIHGAKLIDGKRFALFSDPLLSKKDRAGRVPAYEEHNQEKERKGKKKGEQSKEYIKDAFGK